MCVKRQSTLHGTAPRHHITPTCILILDLLLANSSMHCSAKGVTSPCSDRREKKKRHGMQEWLNAAGRQGGRWQGGLLLRAILVAI